MCARPRAPLPLPAEIEERYALGGEVKEQYLAPLGGEDGLMFFRGLLVAGDESADFEVVVPESATAERPAPFVLCLPILAGGESLLWAIGHGLGKKGFAVGWTRRVESALKPPQRAWDLEVLCRRTVIHDRMLLEWARRQGELDPTRQGLLGVSFGGMVAVALLATEPGLRGGAICLAGANLAELVHESSEHRVRSWVSWRRREDGVTGDVLVQEIERDAVSEPASMGAYVATDRVLLVNASYDTVVPRRFQDLLWESLGRPQRYFVPFGHYTAALALGSVLDQVDGFLRARMAL